jgi:hypothetical protein
VKVVFDGGLWGVEFIVKLAWSRALIHVKPVERLRPEQLDPITSDTRGAPQHPA